MRLSADNIANEVIAGLLWMHLNVPSDASRDEVEDCAGELMRRIRADDSQDSVERAIKTLQIEKFCLPQNVPAIADLAAKSIAIVRASGC